MRLIDRRGRATGAGVGQGKIFSYKVGSFSFVSGHSRCHAVSCVYIERVHGCGSSHAKADRGERKSGCNKHVVVKKYLGFKGHARIQRA